MRKMLSKKNILKSPAKINLTLDILGKDGDYHLVNTVICEVENLYDEITIELLSKTGGKIEIKTSNKELNRDPENNLAYKAAKLIAPKASIRIFIKKNIPLRSGLGGGSSNAATVLKELNRQLGLNLDVRALRHLAATISMDAPFFITGGIARATHFGEIIESIKTDLRLKPQLVFNDKSKTSTAEMYSKIDALPTGRNHAKTEKLIKALADNDLKGVINNLHNDFELLFPTTYPNHLSGAGSAYYFLPYFAKGLNFSS